MILQHRPGLKHVNADALSKSKSRLPCSEFRTDIAVSELPCKGCKFCRKAHADWYKFSRKWAMWKTYRVLHHFFHRGAHMPRIGIPD